MVEVLGKIYDPELPVSIYEMGLIYSVDVDRHDVVTIRMTLTSPACPVAESLPREVESKVKAIDGVSDARVELVWDPPWTGWATAGLQISVPHSGHLGSASPFRM